MAEVSAALVKDLRERTGAGMMDCKRALSETAGDIEAAIDWLRKKGLSKAAKKADRIAAEGLVGVAVRRVGDVGEAVVVEVNSETDFVARNETFQGFVRRAALAGVERQGVIDAITSAPGHGAATLGEELTNLIATIGENMNLRRSQFLRAEPGVVASYVHGSVSDGLGKIGVLVALKSAGAPAPLEALGRKIAMHVAAANPISSRIEDVAPDVVARERAVFADQARASGKPEAVIEKMIEGRLRKFYEESVLLEQVFVMDGETPVKGVIKAAEAEVGAPIELVGFCRLALGEGVERKVEDFAAEVAAVTGQV